MAKFSPYLIEELYSLLKNDYENMFVEIILEKNNHRILSRDFKNYVPEFLENIFYMKTDSANIRLISMNTVRNRNKMKERWLTAIKKEASDLYSMPANARTISKELDGYKKMSELELNKAFGVNTLGELFDNRMNEIKKWGKNKNSKLTSFRYFEEKKPAQKLSAFNYDLTLSIIEIVDTHYAGSLDGFLIQRASELIEKPIFSPKKMLLPLNTIYDETTGTSIAYSDEVQSNDYILRTLIENPEKINLTSFYSLDEKDLEIIDSISSKIDSSFYKDKVIYAEVGEIAKRVYKYTNARVLKEIEERLLKISNYQIQGFIKEGENIKDTLFNINFFDSVVIETDKESKKRIATVIFGSMLHEAYIKNQTVKVAAYQFNQIENPLSKILFFIFQKERLEKSVSEGIPLTEEYHYNFFRNRVKFKSNKEKVNMPLIEESLSEFKQKGLLIKDFQISSSGFHIEFYPLTSGEKKSFGLLPDDNQISLYINDN